jgi:glucose/arabinose dehydrogenase
MKKTYLVIFLIALFFLGLRAITASPKVPTTPNSDPLASTIIADKLQVPWELVFLSDKSILFTERPGRVRKLTPTGSLLETPILTVRDVKASGEGGLLGIVLHPQFAKNSFVYLYYTYSENRGDTLNKVVRYKLKNDKLFEDKIIISSIPGNSFHNGGRLKFGPDGYLYITTGDSQKPSLSQNKNSLAGKILRVTDEGQSVPGNPFNNLVYSYGHRNPQGLAWDEIGNLWETEHGSSAKDEINQIQIGGNFGWDTIVGNQTRLGMITPIINSGKETWAPSGAVYLNPYLYYAGLRSSSLFRFNTKTKELKQYLTGVYGRLRDVVLGPDGFLYLTTSNMDGRALTHLDGDKIIRIDPKSLN